MEVRLKFKVNLGRDKRESRRPFPGIRDNELNPSTIPPKTGRVVTLLPSLYLRHSSFSNPSVAWPTSQFNLKPFFRFSYVTVSSLMSPGEPPIPATPRRSDNVTILGRVTRLLLGQVAVRGATVAQCHQFSNLRSIYTNRSISFKVRVNNNGEYTKNLDQPKGLRQGCSLSPYLFIIFIDDILNEENLNKAQSPPIDNIKFQDYYLRMTYA